MDASLDQLRGLHLDGFIWWPLAPGWYILAALILIITYFLIRFFKNKKENSLYKIAHDELQEIFEEYKVDSNASDYLQELNALLKSICVQKFGRQKVSDLNGENWIDFLNEHAGKKPFNQAQADALSYQIYQQSPTVDIPNLHNQAKVWIKQQYKTQNSMRENHV